MSTAELSLLTLTSEHLSEVMALEQACFSDALSEQQILSMLTNERRYRCFGLEEQGVLQAFAFFSQVLDEAELLQVGVSPDRQGQGIARRFLSGCHQQLSQEGVARLMLEVRASNQAAIRCYRHLGFAEDGIRAGYYPPLPGYSAREDALLMSLAL